MKIPERQKELDALTREYLTDPKTGAGTGTGRVEHRPLEASDEAVLTLCRKAKNADKFTALYDSSDTAAYGGDDSRADMALIGALAFYTQDPDQLARLFSQSALYRPDKWGKRLDYRRGTIDKVLNGLTETYTPPRITPPNSPSSSNSTNSADPPTPEANPLIAGLVGLSNLVKNGVDPPEELEPGILLRGRVHHIFAPAAVGKTYLALWLAARQIARGKNVLCMDAENGARIYTERLQQMGVDPKAIEEHLYYLPFPTLDMGAGGIANYHALIKHINPELVIFDSWIKFLSSAGLEENDNDHIARWAASFLQPIRNADITSVVLDHVPHDGNRSRGASRKRDEVDVQYSLIKTQKFDRATVGEIRLKLEKDREGWLPEFTTFSIGGGEDGFVFARSSGTADGPGQTILKRGEVEVLNVLSREFGMAGARHNEWKNACMKKRVSKSTFDRARDELIRVQMVRREEDAFGTTYLPVMNPPGFKGNEPDFSPLITVIPDRVHAGSNRVHEPDGNKVGSEGSHPLGVNPLNPVHESQSQGDEMRGRVRQALEFGNAPRKALEHYRNGGQDIDPVVKSVMHYFARGKDDPEKWRASVIAEVRGES